MDRLGEARLEDLGLETALHEVLGLKGEDVVEPHALLVEDTNAHKTADESVTLVEREKRERGRRRESVDDAGKRARGVEFEVGRVSTRSGQPGWWSSPLEPSPPVCSLVLLKPQSLSPDSTSSAPAFYPLDFTKGTRRGKWPALAPCPAVGSLARRLFAPAPREEDSRPLLLLVGAAGRFKVCRNRAAERSPRRDAWGPWRRA